MIVVPGGAAAGTEAGVVVGTDASAGLLDETTPAPWMATTVVLGPDEIETKIPAVVVEAEPAVGDGTVPLI